MDDYNKLCEAVSRCIDEAEQIHCIEKSNTAGEFPDAIPSLRPDLIV